MERKNFLSITLLILPLLFLTGCKKNKKIDDKKTSLNQSRGIKLQSGKAAVLDSDRELEEFLLADNDEMFGTKKVKIDTETIQHKTISWKDDQADGSSLEPIYFGFDKSEIREDQKNTLAYDITEAKKIVQKGNALRVEGHADKHFISETYNLAKSQERANKVVNALADAGIDKTYLKPVGFGADKPAVNVSGKNQANRRVEFVTLKA